MRPSKKMGACNAPPRLVGNAWLETLGWKRSVGNRLAKNNLRVSRRHAQIKLRIGNSGGY